MSKKSNTDNLQKFELLKGIRNAIEQPHFDLNQQETFKVNIKPDERIARSLFKPHPFEPECYLAHPVTIRALKKDIFAAGNELFEDLEDLVTCSSCKEQLDRQFWWFCPHCESDLPKKSDY